MATNPTPETPRPVIRAASPTDGPARASLAATAPIEIQAAKGDGKRPTFDIVGYTGAIMSLEGFFNPVIIDLAGFKAGGQEIPALYLHELDRIVGQTDSVSIDAKGVRLTGTITGDNADATEVINQAKNGFKWRASVGATLHRREFLDAGKKATVNGREVTGPLVIAREAELLEISFVSIGADNQTSVNVAASIPPGPPQGSSNMDFEAWLKAKGIDPATVADPVRPVMKAQYDAEQAANKPPPHDPRATQTLEDIVEAQRKEAERIREVTALTKAAIDKRPDLVDEFHRMGKAAIEARTDPAKYELELFRLTDRFQPASGGRAFGIHDGGSSRVVAPRMLEAALCRSGGLENLEKQFDAQTLEAAHARFKNGLGLCDVLSIAARDNGWAGHSVKSDLEGALRAAFPPRDIRAAQGWSTISLPNVFSNTANKFLAAGFNAVETTWRRISDQQPVNDFKAITGIALTGGFTYEKVGPGGELKHATLGETTYTNQAETYGRMMAITRQQIINDDLGALTQIPRKLGRGAAMGLNRDFWTVFLNNSAFFTAGRNNLQTGAGTVLSIASLDAGQAGFLNQTDPDGDPIAVDPVILLVPNALFVNANNFMNSTQVVNNTTANTTTLANNPFAGKFRVEKSSYLSNANFTGNSTTAWYLLADPAVMPVIQVVFLNGKQDPTIENADADFNTLGIQFRGFWDYGVAFQEFRGGVKMAGA